MEGEVEVECSTSVLSGSGEANTLQKELDKSASAHLNGDSTPTHDPIVIEPVDLMEENGDYEGQTIHLSSPAPPRRDSLVSNEEGELSGEAVSPNHHDRSPSQESGELHRRTSDGADELGSLKAEERSTSMKRKASPVNSDVSPRAKAKVARVPSPRATSRSPKSRRLTPSPPPSDRYRDYGSPSRDLDEYHSRRRSHGRESQPQFYHSRDQRGRSGQYPRDRTGGTGYNTVTGEINTSTLNGPVPYKYPTDLEAGEILSALKNVPSFVIQDVKDMSVDDSKVREACKSTPYIWPVSLLIKYLYSQYHLEAKQQWKEVYNAKDELFTMKCRVDNLEVQVHAANKKEGRQVAAQAMLKTLFPRCSTYWDLVESVAFSIKRAPPPPPRGRGGYRGGDRGRSSYHDDRGGGYGYRGGGYGGYRGGGGDGAYDRGYRSSGYDSYAAPPNYAQERPLYSEYGRGSGARPRSDPYYRGAGYEAAPYERSRYADYSPPPVRREYRDYDRHYEAPAPRPRAYAPPVEPGYERKHYPPSSYSAAAPAPHGYSPPPARAYSPAHRAYSPPSPLHPTRRYSPPPPIRAPPPYREPAPASYERSPFERTAAVDDAYDTGEWDKQYQKAWADDTPGYDRRSNDSPATFYGKQSPEFGLRERDPYARMGSPLPPPPTRSLSPLPPPPARTAFPAKEEYRTREYARRSPSPSPAPPRAPASPGRIRAAGVTRQRASPGSTRLTRRPTPPAQYRLSPSPERYVERRSSPPPLPSSRSRYRPPSPLGAPPSPREPFPKSPLVNWDRKSRSRSPSPEWG